MSENFSIDKSFSNCSEDLDEGYADPQETSRPEHTPELMNPQKAKPISPAPKPLSHSYTTHKLPIPKHPQKGRNSPNLFSHNKNSYQK